jgi:hypothetical protein
MGTHKIIQILFALDAPYSEFCEDGLMMVD